MQPSCPYSTPDQTIPNTHKQPLPVKQPYLNNLVDLVLGDAAVAVHVVQVEGPLQFLDGLS